MGLLVQTWHTLTEAQATVISGILTLFAAVLGVLIGWWLLSGKVKDLENALEKSKGEIISHRDFVQKILSQVQDKIEGFDQQFASTIETLGQLRGVVSDIQSDTANATSEPPTKETLRSAWEPIRDKLEAIAAGEKDGRTRAKYARIDRRQYVKLVDALDRDSKLNGQGAIYRQAVELWQSFRNGKRSPSDADCTSMERYKSQLFAS